MKIYVNDCEIRCKGRIIDLNQCLFIVILREQIIIFAPFYRDSTLCSI